MFPMPKIVEEIEEWGKDGLIKSVNKADLIDETLASILKVVREHLNESSRT